MKNKYINGMNEINTNEEFKNKMLCIAEKENIKQTKYPFPYRKLAYVFAAAFLFVLFFNFGFPYIQDTKDDVISQSSVTNTLFGGFIITAFAADSSSFEIKPDVDFPIGKYQLTMSSVPGFPLKIVCDDAESVKVCITNGELLLWNSSDSKIHYKGKELIIKSGDTIYWSPLRENSQNTVSSSAISIIAYKGDKEIGKNIIKIETDDKISYTGRLTE